MNSFIQYVLYELQNSLGLVILGGLLAAIAIAVAYVLFKKKHKPFPWKRIFLYLLLAGYLLIVLYATLLRGHGSYRQEYNLHLFRAWLEAWNNFSVKNWANILLNIAMFAPLGALLPLLWKKCRNWFLTIPIGFALSFAIELIQFAIGRGICDVDDLFANTLGAAMGYFCGMAVLSLRRKTGKRLKPFLLHFGLALLPVIAVGSIFVAYACKEYGNLPDAPAYTNNTRNVQWTLDCQLPTPQDTVAVYRTQTRTPAQCDAFAEALAQTTGKIVDLTSYYQEYAYYNLHSGGLLLVDYYDGSYTFHIGSAHDTQWIEADRKTIENALSNYPVQIPTQAEFCYDGEGWHSFTVSRHIDGALLFDGTLRARYAASGAVEVLENDLCTYAYYDDAPIISPEQAYAQLRAGKFGGGAYFAYAAPKEITVTDCYFDYRVDTKGFYQPVYIFCLASPDGTYAYDAMIPALTF